jgi:hypothetical protein
MLDHYLQDSLSSTIVPCPFQTLTKLARLSVAKMHLLPSFSAKTNGSSRDIPLELHWLFLSSEFVSPIGWANMRVSACLLRYGLESTLRQLVCRYNVENTPYFYPPGYKASIKMSTVDCNRNTIQG